MFYLTCWEVHLVDFHSAAQYRTLQKRKASARNVSHDSHPIVFWKISYYYLDVDVAVRIHTYGLKKVKPVNWDTCTDLYICWSSFEISMGIPPSLWRALQTGDGESGHLRQSKARCRRCATDVHFQQCTSHPGRPPCDRLSQATASAQIAVMRVGVDASLLWPATG